MEERLTWRSKCAVEGQLQQSARSQKVALLNGAGGGSNFFERARYVRCWGSAATPKPRGSGVSKSDVSHSLKIIQLVSIVPLSRMGFPEEICCKYQQLEPAYTFTGDEEIRNFQLIKHIVCAAGLRHFVVKDPEGIILREFTHHGCNEAFMAACRFAEEQGKPWMVSNGPLFFDPPSARCWTTHQVAHVAEMPVEGDG